MSLDLKILGDKLRRFREQLAVPLGELTRRTGISLDRLSSFEAASTLPSGDEILILADYYRCDYRFFISNDKLSAFDQTEMLFRKHDDQFSPADRRAVQDFLFLCECEYDLLRRKQPVTPKRLRLSRDFSPREQAEHAAVALRKFLGLPPHKLEHDVYDAIRRLGIRVFRRRLANSRISGLFIQHPVAGPCILVNYGEDTFRQRFTAAHELGHAIFDATDEFVVSFSGHDTSVIEQRANTFASRFLMPPEFLRLIPESNQWNRDKLLYWAQRMRVNPESLCYALKQARLMTSQGVNQLKGTRLPRESKVDPEIPPTLAEGSQIRMRASLALGLSRPYVSLCFEAYAEGYVSWARLSEMLLTDETNLTEIALQYGVGITHGD